MSFPDRRTIIAITIVSALVLCIFMLIFRPIPAAADSDILKLLVGALISQTATVINFDFGSSVGSEHKQQTMDTLMIGSPERRSGTLSTSASSIVAAAESAPPASPAPPAPPVA